MITFELSGTGGLQEKLTDGTLVTLYRGELIIAKNGKLLAKLLPDQLAMADKIVTMASELFRLFRDYLSEKGGRTYPVVSRHAVEYVERNFDYEYRWVTDERKNIVPLTLSIDPLKIRDTLRLKRIGSPTSEDELMQKVQRAHLESAFTKNGYHPISL